MQMLYDKGLFDAYPNADEVLKKFMFVTRHRGDLEESKRSRSMILFLNNN